MSNQGEPWKKFVQTFFLAEQPNGYFVLNDIFRFLKEETVEDEPSDDTEPPVQDAPVDQEPSSAPVVTFVTPSAEPEPEVVPEPTPVTAPTPAPAPEAEEPAPAVSEPAAEQHPNGHAETTPAPEPEPTRAEPSAPSVAEVSVAPSPLPASPAPPAETSTLAPAQPSAPAPAPTAAAATAPAAPAPQPVRKTWANLAATGSNKWGTAVTQEVKGISEAPASPAPSTPHSPAPHARSQNQPHPAFVAANNASTAQCFVKVSATPYR